MQLSKVKTVYFLGIGGIGMSALARYFKTQGCAVSGYDRTETELTRQLIAEGIAVHYSESIEKIPQQLDLVIYTPAIPKEHIAFAFFEKNKTPLYKRSEVLGLITQNKRGIAVSGTHGKTTITTMIAHILNHTKEGVNAFLGGISKNYNSNILLSSQSDYVVVEADEYDRSFLKLSPEIAIVTSIDADHLDIYGDKDHLKQSFQEFIDKESVKTLFIKKGLGLNNPENTFTYSLNDFGADYFVQNIRVSKGSYYFDFYQKGGEVWNDMKLNYPGIHNIENAVVAMAIAKYSGVDEQTIRQSVADFAGVKRRFDYHIRREDLVFIDDYAHHPAELKACIESVKHLYPNKKITGIFQPHLYSRTRDFTDEFAQSLSLLDEVILLDIYPARELPIAGVSSKMLLHKINKMDKYYCENLEQLLTLLHALYPQVLLTLGAGDIDKWVEPIEKSF